MSAPDVFGLNQSPDGTVAVFNGQKRYVDTLDNFQADFAVTLPALPSGGTNRIYEQNRRHPIILAGNVVDGGPMPWTMGDQIIANIDAGLAAQAARQPSNIAPPSMRDLPSPRGGGHA
jgi:hypothetical protein